MMKKQNIFEIMYSIIIVVFLVADVTTNILSSKIILRWELIVLLMSLPIAYYIQSFSKVKINKDGIEFEKLKNESDKVIKSFINGKIISHEDINTLFLSVEANDWSKLTLTRMLMRNAFIRLLPDHGLGSSPSLVKLINLAIEKKLLSKTESEQLERIRYITYYAEWWSGEEPKISEWNWAINNAKEIITMLFSKLK